MIHPLRVVIRRFDGWLSRIEGVEAFSDDPQVIVRIQVAKAAHRIELPDLSVPEGASVLMLHLDNERVPVIPAAGADLAYAVRLQRTVLHSWRAVAGEMRADSTLTHLPALGAVGAFLLLGAEGGASAMKRYGFTQVAYQSPGGAFGHFWENFYAWWLMWTYNPPSVRHRGISDLRRAEFWISREAFLQRYGAN